MEKNTDRINHVATGPCVQDSKVDFERQQEQEQIQLKVGVTSDGSIFFISIALPSTYSLCFLQIIWGFFWQQGIFLDGCRRINLLQSTNTQVDFHVLQPPPFLTLPLYSRSNPHTLFDLNPSGINL